MKHQTIEGLFTELAGYSFYDGGRITRETDGWSFEREELSFWVDEAATWTYEDGIEWHGLEPIAYVGLREAYEHATPEFLQWHLGEALEDVGIGGSVEFAYLIVTDEDLEYDEDEGVHRDKDGELVYDNFAGWTVVLAR